MAKIEKDVTIIIKGNQAKVLLDLFNNSFNLSINSEPPHFMRPDLKGNPSGVLVNNNASVDMSALIDRRNVPTLKSLISELRSE